MKDRLEAVCGPLCPAFSSIHRTDHGWCEEATRDEHGETLGALRVCVGQPCVRREMGEQLRLEVAV